MNFPDRVRAEDWFEAAFLPIDHVGHDDRAGDQIAFVIDGLTVLTLQELRLVRPAAHFYDLSDQDLLSCLLSSPLARSWINGPMDGSSDVRVRVRELARSDRLSRFQRAIAALILVDHWYIAPARLAIRSASDDLLEFQPLLIEQWDNLLTSTYQLVRDRSAELAPFVFAIPVNHAATVSPLSVQLRKVIRNCAWPEHVVNRAAAHLDDVYETQQALAAGRMLDPEAALDALGKAIKTHSVAEFGVVSVVDELAAHVSACESYSVVAMLDGRALEDGRELIEIAFSLDGKTSFVKHLAVRFAKPDGSRSMWDAAPTESFTTDGKWARPEEEYFRLLAEFAAKQGQTISWRPVSLSELLAEQDARRNWTR